MSVGQTGTEIIVEVMERFQHGEPTSMIIVWADDQGKINMKTNCVNSHALRLAEFSKHNLLEGIFGR